MVAERPIRIEDRAWSELSIQTSEVQAFFKDSTYTRLGDDIQALF
jgi:hypothetical protein